MKENPPGVSLPRVLGYTTATAIVVGTVIGSGVFKKANVVAQSVPEAGVALLAWVLVGVLTLLGALSLAEVAVVVGRAGGNYAILGQAYGRWAGFLWGWVEFWIIRSGSIAALATIFTESLHDILREARGQPGDLLGPWSQAAITCAVIAVLGLINARGTHLGGGLQVFVTLVKALSLIGIAILPFVILAFVSEPRATPSFSRLEPLWPTHTGTTYWIAFGGALVGIFWAYHGWMNIAPVVEEIKNPQRNLPFALLTGVFILIVLYVSVNIAYYLVIPTSEIATVQGRTVAGEFSVRLLGSVGLLLASLAVMISVFGSMNGNLLVGPRLLYAMAQDGLAPRSLGTLHPRYQTPARAELVLTGWCVLEVLLVTALTQVKLPNLDLGWWQIDFNLPAKAPFDVITDFAMFGAISFETLSVASIFVFRRRFPPSQLALPYRCPLYPWVPAVYVICLTMVLANMFRSQRAESLTGVGFILVGAAIYMLFLRRPR